MKILYILLIVLWCSECGVCADFDCSSKHLETCTQQLMEYSRDDVLVPETEEQVVQNCGIIRNGTRCIRRFLGTCAPVNIRQIGRMVMSGVMKAIGKACSADGIRDFLAHRDCIVSIKRPTQLCYQDMVRDLHRANGAQTEQLHSAICCFISKMHECNSNALTSSCKAEAKQLYGHETERMVDDLMELICPASLRWGQPDCKALDEQISQTDLPETERISILSLVINLMKRLAD